MKERKKQIFAEKKNKAPIDIIIERTLSLYLWNQGSSMHHNYLKFEKLTTQMQLILKSSFWICFVYSLSFNLCEIDSKVFCFHFWSVVCLILSRGWGPILSRDYAWAEIYLFGKAKHSPKLNMAALRSKAFLLKNCILAGEKWWSWIAECIASSWLISFIYHSVNVLHYIV